MNNPTTADTWLKFAEKTLINSNIISARIDSLLMLESVLKITREQSIISGARLNVDQSNQLDILLRERLSNKPMAYILGSKEFFGRKFNVNQSTLIPRPETESIVEYIKNNPRKSYLEIGTGSGCISISIAKELPNTSVTATDISTEALNIARLNSKNHNAKVKFIESDLFSNIDSKYDVIVANLPYLPTPSGHKCNKCETNQEINFEPVDALFSGDDGLSLYRLLSKDYSKYINPGGYLIIEHLPCQYESLVEIFDTELEKVIKFISTKKLPS